MLGRADRLLGQACERVNEAARPFGTALGAGHAVAEGRVVAEGARAQRARGREGTGGTTLSSSRRHCAAQTRPEGGWRRARDAVRLQARVRSGAGARRIGMPWHLVGTDDGERPEGVFVALTVVKNVGVQLSLGARERGVVACRPLRPPGLLAARSRLEFVGCADQWALVCVVWTRHQREGVDEGGRGWTRHIGEDWSDLAFAEVSRQTTDARRREA
eukprot:7344705-Prymnesium_polylepis.1